MILTSLLVQESQRCGRYSCYDRSLSHINDLVTYYLEPDTNTSLATHNKSLPLRGHHSIINPHIVNHAGPEGTGL